MTITPLDLTAYHITGTRFIALGDKLNEIITALNSREEKEQASNKETIDEREWVEDFDSGFIKPLETKDISLPDQREELERVINDSLPLNRPVVLPDITVLIDLILARWNLTPKSK